MTVSEKKRRVVLRMFGMFQPYSCYDLLNGLIKCPFVIHTYLILCNGHTELKKSR